MAAPFQHESIKNDEVFTIVTLVHSGAKYKTVRRNRVKCGATNLQCIIRDVYTQDKWTAYNPCKTAVFWGYFSVAYI